MESEAFRSQIEPIEPGETISQYLSRLEETGRYLFHGSPHDIDIIEPRKATDISGDPWRNDTAVYANSNAALSIQRAILPPRDQIEGKWTVSSGTDPENSTIPLLVISDNIHLQSGVVYVLDRQGFERSATGSQWKSKNSVKPLIKISVDSTIYAELGGKIERKVAGAGVEPANSPVYESGALTN